MRLGFGHLLIPLSVVSCGAGAVRPAATPSATDAGDSAGVAENEQSPVPASSAGSPAPRESARPAQTSADLLEVEAHVSLDVDEVRAAATAIRQLAKAHAGQVTSDSIESAATARASFTIRVPGPQTDAFLDDLGKVGTVRSRQVTATDVTRQYHDAQVVLENLTTTMKRYEEILARANTVEEVLRIEQELARLRTEIDRVKGELRFMADRVSRSTLYLSVSSTKADSYVESEPVAKLYPGVRAASLVDFRGDEGIDAYAGGGISVRFARSFSLDFDGYRSVGATGSAGGLDAWTATLGGEFYSDFLGGGRRRFFNPFLGFFAGYARVRASSEGAFGATAGVELYKGKVVVVDAGVRAYGLVGGPIVHAAAEPSLGVNVAF